MGSEYLGEFEQMVLLSVMRLDEGAYGLAVRDEMERVTGRSPSSGALYTTLDRLERKGLLASREGDSSSDRGGRPRRYLTVTAAGHAALSHSREALLALWDGLETHLDRA
ncbi:MAG: PadR family transcriptional regulator [Longimicrobiales bacterium]